MFNQADLLLDYASEEKKKPMITQHFLLKHYRSRQNVKFSVCHHANVCLPQFSFLSDSPSF